MPYKSTFFDVWMSEPFSLVDDLRVQHAKPVKAWLDQNKAHIEVFYLPSYCPELNPDEMLNANLKAAVTSQAPH